MKKYVARDVRVERTTVITDQNTFPSVTVCLKPPNKKAYCGYDIVKNSERFEELEKKCPEYKGEKVLENTVIRKEKSITLGGFHVTCQQSGIICDDSIDLNPKYFKLVKNFPECLQWNGAGDFFNNENRLDLQIEIRNNNTEFFNKIEDDIRLYVNDKSIYLALQENFLTTTLWQHYLLSFKKTVKQRLPAPYTSHCVKNSKDNIFSDEYSLISCLESKRCLESYKACGDTYDFCRPFIPESVKREYYKPDKKIYDMHVCLERNYYTTRKVTDCDLPCDETEFNIYGSSYHFKESDGNKKFKLSMRFEIPYVYEQANEEVLYSWGDLLGGVGGNVGLFCGFSMLSLVEIFSFVLLRLYAKGAKKRLVRQERIWRQSQAAFEDVEIEVERGANKRYSQTLV